MTVYTHWGGIGHKVVVQHASSPLRLNDLV